MTINNEFFDTDINKAYSFGYAEGATGTLPRHRSNVNPLWNRAYHLGITDGVEYALKNGMDLTCSVRWIDLTGHPTPHETPVKASYLGWLCGPSCCVFHPMCERHMKTGSCDCPVIPYPTHSPLAICEAHVKANKLANWIIVPMGDL
jgi:hypothetical protein